MQAFCVCFGVSHFPLELQEVFSRGAQLHIILLHGLLQLVLLLLQRLQLHTHTHTHTHGIAHILDCMLFYSGVESKIYPTGILQGSEKCGKYFPDLKMLGKKESRVWKNICVSRLLSIFSFIVQEVKVKIWQCIQGAFFHYAKLQVISILGLFLQYS